MKKCSYCKKFIIATILLSIGLSSSIYATETTYLDDLPIEIELPVLPEPPTEDTVLDQNTPSDNPHPLSEEELQAKFLEILKGILESRNQDLLKTDIEHLKDLYDTHIKTVHPVPRYHLHRRSYH